MAIKPAARLDGVELSLIRQINALATPLSINLGIGEPNVEPDERLRAMARDVATHGSWHYTPNPGSLSLRKKLAAAHAPSADPKSEICVTAGTEEALYAIFQAYVDAGDEVLVPNPGFVVYETIATLCGATTVRYDIEPPEWRLEAADVIAKIGAKTKLIVINSPSNPLGSVADAETLAMIAAEAAARGCLVVSDEVYRTIWYDAEPPSMTGLGENVLVVSGLSKSHAMTGLRLGWIVASEATLAPVIKAHQYIATCASAFSQDLAERILDDGEWNAGWLARLRTQFREQRDAALQSIEQELHAAIPAPSGAFYAFVPIPLCNSLPFAKSLAIDAAVLVIPGIAFGSRGEGFVRISYAASLDDIANGVARIGRYLRGVNR